MKKFIKKLLSLSMLLIANPAFAQNDLELDFHEISVGAPISNISSEISGLTWYKDNLIILPQFPDFTSGKNRVLPDDGFIYTVKKKQIIDFINGNNSVINPSKIKLIAPGLSKLFGTEGFESITFIGDNVYVILEAKDRVMFNYLLTGKINPDLSSITLDTANYSIINTQSDINNIAYETIIPYNNEIIAIHEANGKKNNIHPLSPVAYVFNKDLKYSKEISFPNIEYRITDATRPENDFFWVINYRYPKDFKDTTDKDLVFENYPAGTTHKDKKHVERLIKLKITSKGIEISDTPPIQIKLSDTPRNWEAVTKLDNLGFIIATDQNDNPKQGNKTIFGFIPYIDKEINHIE